MPLSGSEDVHAPAALYNPEGEGGTDDAGLMYRPQKAAGGFNNNNNNNDRSFVDSFLAPAGRAVDSSGTTRLHDPNERVNHRPTPRRNPIPAPHRTPAAVTSLHSAPTQDLILRDLQPLDRDGDADDDAYDDDDIVAMEQKSPSEPVAVAIAVTDDADARFRDTPPLATVRQGRSRLHVPAHIIPLPPVRLPPTSNPRQQQQQQALPPRRGQQQQQDG